MFPEDDLRNDGVPLTARKTKPKKKTKPKRKTAKPKKKAKRPAKKNKAAKRKNPKAKKTGAAVVRSERLDMRLTKAEKVRVVAKAKKTRRTVTSLVIEAIEKIR